MATLGGLIKDTALDATLSIEGLGGPMEGEDAAETAGREHHFEAEVIEGRAPTDAGRIARAVVALKRNPWPWLVAGGAVVAAVVIALGKRKG